MEEKDLKALTDKIDAKFEEIQKGLDTNSDNAGKYQKDIHDIKEQLKLVPDKGYVEKLQAQADALEATTKKLSDMANRNFEPVNDLKEALHSDDYKAFVDGKKGEKFGFQTKTTISTANSFTETDTNIIPRHRDPRIGGDPMAGLPVQQLVNRFTLGDSDYVDWFERTSETNNAGWKAEAATSVEGVLGWTGYKVPVEDIKHHYTVSKRKLRDTNWMMSTIQGRLLYQLNAGIEDSILDGTGTSNTLCGLIGASYAKTFNAPTVFEANVKYANYLDVLQAAAAQIGIGYSGTNALAGGFDCTAHIVSPADYYFMTMLKDEMGRSLIGADGVMRAYGVPIYKSFFITAGTFLSGDFSKSTLWMREGISVEIWDQTASNALTGLVTVLATASCALETHVADYYAYVTGTFTTGLSEILYSGD